MLEMFIGSSFSIPFMSFPCFDMTGISHEKSVKTVSNRPRVLQLRCGVADVGLDGSAIDQGARQRPGKIIAGDR